MLGQFYFCTECNKEIKAQEDILFIQEANPKGFCCEDCIDEHYLPMRRSFLNAELQFRHEHGLDDDVSLADRELLDADILFMPDEIWMQENLIGEKFYIHIKHDEKKTNFVLAILSYVNETPSYIYHKFYTQSFQLIEHFRHGLELSALEANETDGAENFEIMQTQLDQEVLDELESKHSQLLAELLSFHDPADIALEEYPLYEKYLMECLDTPDEIFISIDETGDEIQTHIKSFKENDNQFFYITICWPIDADDIAQLVPILSFPSKDKNLYQQFAKGQRQSKIIKN